MNEKDFPHQKKLPKVGLEPGPKWAKFIFSNFLLHKNLDKNLIDFLNKMKFQKGSLGFKTILK